MTTPSIATRLWHKDLDVFSAAAGADARASIANRLGWLDAPAAMRAHLDTIDAVAQACATDGITHIALLGMGGSSLCAEVLRLTRAAADRRRRVFVLDTTDERAIREASAALPPASTVFIVASKSGSTIEVTSLEAYFRTWLTSHGVQHAGRSMIAITDPDTALQAHAARHGYRHTFINPADIGGRFSALSLFGLVPAALMGIPPATLLDSADRMVTACRADDDQNPGVALGRFMATHASAGRDKLSIELPASMAALGLWIEQLVAESTGKQGRGVLPIVDEPPSDSLDAYGTDRAFVLVGDANDDVLEARLAQLTEAGYPVHVIHAGPADLGAEFFRWEFATAVAGVVLDVNPFDEPNVRDAKSRTSALLAAPGGLTVTPALSRIGDRLQRQHGTERLSDLPADTYVAILDYLPQDARRSEAVARARRHLRRRFGLATTYGAGPRYLHSTGQYHKGGTNNGVFILLTAADASQTPVPDASFTFSTLKHAQALGDFDALVANGRTVLHAHIDQTDADFSQELMDLVDGLQ